MLEKKFQEIDKEGKIALSSRFFNRLHAFFIEQEINSQREVHENDIDNFDVSDGGNFGRSFRPIYRYFAFNDCVSDDFTSYTAVRRNQTHINTSFSPPQPIRNHHARSISPLSYLQSPPRLSPAGKKVMITAQINCVL